MAPDLNKKLEDEVEKYRQTQNGSLPIFLCLDLCLFVDCRYEKVCNSTTTVICDKN